MKESVIIQKLIEVGQMLERGELEYSGAEADTIYLLERYSELRKLSVSDTFCKHNNQRPSKYLSEWNYCPNCKNLIR